MDSQLASRIAKAIEYWKMGLYPLKREDLSSPGFNPNYTSEFLDIDVDADIDYLIKRYDFYMRGEGMRICRGDVTEARIMTMRDYFATLEI